MKEFGRVGFLIEGIVVPHHLFDLHRFGGDPRPHIEETPDIAKGDTIGIGLEGDGGRPHEIGVLDDAKTFVTGMLGIGISPLPGEQRSDPGPPWRRRGCQHFQGHL